MTGINRLWKMFLYGGVEKEEYEKLLPRIRKENLALLNAFSMLAAVMFFLLYIVSVSSQGIATTNSATYLLCGIEMLAIFFFARLVLPNRPMLTMALVYIFEITLHIFGIHISMLHADNPAVSAVAFLLVTPLLFYDRPIRLSALIAAFVVLFSAIAVHFKAPEVAETDVWNVITFGIVAVATTVFTASIKMRALEQARQIEYLSQADLLTGINNRNYYEKRLEDYPQMCSSNLNCVYADVNGLHELNHREGHDAGDRMLREVAEAMQRCFGKEDTYRIGGDEFVAFRVDSLPQSLPLEIDQLQKSLGEKGYHVSFGTAVYEKTQNDLNMHAIVNEAESNMFANKQAFYRRAENDRRSR